MKKKKLPKMRNLVVVHMIKRKCGAHKNTPNISKESYEN